MKFTHYTHLLLFFSFYHLSAQDNIKVHFPMKENINIIINDVDSLYFNEDNADINIRKKNNSLLSFPVNTIDSITFYDELSNSKYKSPTYADDYAAIAAWSNRSSWNLANTHDPTIEKCGDYYYMFGTDASYGNAHNAVSGHFPYKRSKDLVTWSFRGMAMTSTPSWVLDTLNNMRKDEGLPEITNPAYGYWAPVVRKVGDKYRMYYSIIIDNYIKTGNPCSSSEFDGSWSERAFIGLMENDDLSKNNWVDKGMVIYSATDRGRDWNRNSTNDWSAYFKWNAIDPSFIIDNDGKHWLIYGSWHSGIVAVELDPVTGKPFKLDNINDFGTRIARRVNNDNNRWQAQEGPEIIYNEVTGYYYLFLAYDALDVPYNTRVCRSKNILGPYLGYNGENITLGNECWPMVTHPYKFNDHSGWVGISHCCIFKNPDTKEWFYCSQGRLPGNTNGNAYSNAIMMGHIKKIRWTNDGWPVVMPERYSAVPDRIIKESELIGTWEVIKADYKYGVQQTSVRLELKENGKSTGAFTGIWSYENSLKQLKIGNFTFYVERELDWENDPRCETIVFSGLSNTGKPYWAKKIE